MRQNVQNPTDQKRFTPTGQPEIVHWNCRKAYSTTSARHPVIENLFYNMRGFILFWVTGGETLNIDADRWQPTKERSIMVAAVHCSGISKYRLCAE